MRRTWRSALALAATVVVLGAAASIYLFTIKQWHLPAPRYLFRFDLVRAYLFDPQERRLLDLLARERPTVAGPDAFAAVWDTTEGVVLSRALFRPVEMFGEPRYMYRPNVRKLSVYLAAGTHAFKVSFEDRPAIRASLGGLDVQKIAVASYDALGFRHVDPGLASGCDTRAMFLGDSFTDGLWVADGETFASRYASLARETGERGVCAINAGVDGYGSLEEAYVLEQFFDAAGRPPLVFVQHFPNDIDADYERVMEGTLAGAASKWERSLSFVRRMAAFCRAHGAQLVLVAMPTSYERRRPEQRHNYQDRLAAFARDEHIRFVDLLDPLSRDPDDAYFWSWDPHLTPRGHEAVAGALLAATRDLIRQPHR